MSLLRSPELSVSFAVVWLQITAKCWLLIAAVCEHRVREEIYRKTKEALTTSRE